MSTSHRSFNHHSSLLSLLSSSLPSSLFPPEAFVCSDLFRSPIFSRSYVRIFRHRPGAPSDDVRRRVSPLEQVPVCNHSPRGDSRARGRLRRRHLQGSIIQTFREPHHCEAGARPVRGRQASSPLRAVRSRLVERTGRSGCSVHSMKSQAAGAIDLAV